MKTIYYFAYGSNMDMEQMRRRCPDAKCIDTAVLHPVRSVPARFGHSHCRHT